MKFIELTDVFGNKITINFDRIESFKEVVDNKETFTRLDIVSDTTYYMYVKETYKQVKEAVGVE
jgi:uncharacterized protein (DUF927 family)